MTEPKPKNRPRFQFSLMTAIVMMLAAGGLLGLNMVPRKNCRRENVYGSPYPALSIPTKGYLLIKNEDMMEIIENWQPIGPPPILWEDEPVEDRVIYRQISMPGVTKDAVFAFLTLGLSCFVCESLVRRRDHLRRKRESAESAQSQKRRNLRILSAASEPVPPREPSCFALTRLPGLELQMWTMIMKKPRRFHGGYATILPNALALLIQMAGKLPAFPDACAAFCFAA